MSDFIGISELNLGKLLKPKQPTPSKSKKKCKSCSKDKKCLRCKMKSKG